MILRGMLTAQLNRTRRLGVELEMTVPVVGGGGASELRQTMARILTANGLPAIARSYSHSSIPPGCDVVIESDSSIRGETRYQGIEWIEIEAKTKILDGVSEYDRIVGRLIDICRYLGARVNASCGFHLHVEFSEVRQDPSVIRSLYNIAHRVEPVMFGLVAPFRKHSHYCKPLPDRSKLLHDCRTMAEYERVLQGAGLERYWAINLIHLFGSSPRIEFRHHHGTLEFEKTRHWRNLCVRLLDHAVLRKCKATKAQLLNDKESLGRMLVTLGLKPNTRVYGRVEPELRATGRFLLKRWQQLNQQGAAPSASSIPTATRAGFADAEQASGQPHSP